jgi:hypothetical protein
MKNHLNLTSLIVLTLNMILNSFYQPMNELPIYELPLSGSQPQDALDLLPKGYAVPERLPAKISDPLLLAAWVYLYNQTDAITIHDGETISGHELAVYALEREVPVEWGSDEICRGNSCSVRKICKNIWCVKTSLNTKVATIYVSQRYYETTPEAIAMIAGTMGHELYHHQLPFGPVYSSLYEEFWAYTIGGTISQADWADFEGYNPLKAACLKQWFTERNWKGFTDSDLYPFTVDLDVDLTSQTCK